MGEQGKGKILIYFFGAYTEAYITVKCIRKKGISEVQ